MNDNSERYFGVLLEQVRDNLQRFMEAMSDVPADTKKLMSDVAELKVDVGVIKAVVADHNALPVDYQNRIAALEQN